MWLQVTPQTQSPDQYLDGSPIDRYVFMGLLAAGLLVLVGRSVQVGRLLRKNGLILLFFSFCVLSALWSDYPDVTFKRWIKGIGDFVMVLLVLTELAPGVAVKRLLARVGFVLIPLSILFIKYYPQLGRGFSQWTWSMFYMGVTVDKNQLGMISMLFGLGAAWRFFTVLRDKSQSHRRRHLLAQGAVLAMALWILWKANSVTAIACFVMGATVLAVTNLFKLGRRPAAVHILVLAMMSFSLFVLFLAPASGVLESMGRNPTLTGRTEIWSQVLPLNTNPLFGAGYESFWLGDRLKQVWSLYWWHPNEAHNGYLEVYLNLGWIGITLLLLLMVKGYRNVVAAFRLDPESGSIRIAYFVVAVAYNFSESAFRMLNPIWIFFLLATTTVPVPSAPEDGSLLSVERAEDFAEREVPVPAFSARLSGKNI